MEMETEAKKQMGKELTLMMEKMEKQRRRHVEKLETQAPPKTKHTKARHVPSLMRGQGKSQSKCKEVVMEQETQAKQQMGKQMTLTLK